MPGSEGEHRIGREVPGVDEQIGNRGGQAADQRRDCQRRVQAPEPRAGDVPDLDLLHAAVEHERRLERSEEHTSELQSQSNLVCRLLLDKTKPSTGPTCPLYTTSSTIP